MLTINRPYYEYRDIYLFIAVGLAAFITTFIVLGVITTTNINQLNQSTQENRSSGSVRVTDKKTSDDSASKSNESGTSSGVGSTAKPQRNDASNQQKTGNRQALPLQTPAISSPITTGSATGPTGNTLPPTIIVHQAAPNPTPASTTSSPQHTDGLVDVQLPLGISLNLL